jgi:Tol biopolymer transport system component
MPTAQPTATSTPLPPTATATRTPRPSPTATPTHTPLGGWLVFQSKRQDTNGDGVVGDGDHVHLYRLNLTTNELTQLTFGPHSNYYPDWSPDGRQIVFSSGRDGNFELYVMDADGSNVRRLTNTPEDEITPRWSPDGSQIVYVFRKTVEYGLYDTHLLLMSADGSQVEQLTNGLYENDDEPAWSPDGRYLAFTRKWRVLRGQDSYYWDSGVYLMDVVTRETYLLTPPIESGFGSFDEPKWLPRQGYFLSMLHGLPRDTGERHLKVYQLQWDNDQPALHQVLLIRDPGFRYTWGPNGEWLVMTYIGNSDPDLPWDAPYDLFLLSIRLPEPESQLTLNPATQHSPQLSAWDNQEWITDNTFYDDSPDWSP